MNTKFTNKIPLAKFAEYGDNEKARGLSLKLQEMFDVVEANKVKKNKDNIEWYEDEIAEAEAKAVERLRKNLSSLQI